MDGWGWEDYRRTCPTLFGFVGISERRPIDRKDRDKDKKDPNQEIVENGCSSRIVECIPKFRHFDSSFIFTDVLVIGET